MLAISEMNADQERASASRLEIHNHDRYVRPLVYRHAPFWAPRLLPAPTLHQMATDIKHAFETQSHVLPSLFSVQCGVADAHSPEPTSHISLTAAHVSDRSAHLDLRTLQQTIESAPQLLRPCAAPSVARYKTVKNYGHRLLWHLPCLFPLRCALSLVMHASVVVAGVVGLLNLLSRFDSSSPLLPQERACILLPDMVHISQNAI